MLPKTHQRSGRPLDGFEKAGLWSHVLLAACKRDEYSWEVEGRGRFTNALLISLDAYMKGAALQVTYEDLIGNLDPLDE